MKDSLKKQIKERLVLVYKSEEKAEAATKLIDEQLNGYETTEALETPLSEKDSILITYGDTITDGEKPGLEVLHQFLNKYVGEAIETVHLLPMYPYTSDDGFSVVDYRKINPELGDWEQIKEMSSDYGLMFDAVINHISKSSEWFEGYLKGEEPYKNYFITCDKDADYSTVTRPRALPLLTKFQTKDGEKYVWTTFSDDQIDLNFECPELLAEILDILVMYGRSGAKFIRLDAIGFMWKELGTTCMHLPETHELIKLMKDVLKVYAPGTRIITETNVPHKDNISYFGENGDEADLVYQFPLPPLTMYTFLSENAKILSNWMETLELPNDKVTYFNFLSSHDGIGVRPTEGILTEEQRKLLLDATLRHKGDVKAIIDSLTELEKTAEETGTYLYLEPLNRYQDHMLNTQEDAVNIIRQGGFKRVKLTSDFYHMAIEEDDISETLKKYKDYVGHIHIAENHRYQPGTGSIDWKRHMETLKERTTCDSKTGGLYSEVDLCAV